MTGIDDQSRQLRGSWLAWVWVLPQALLMWINVRVWMLVHGDLAEAQRTLALQVGACEVALLLAGVASLAWYSLRRKSIGPWLALATLGLHVGYLWFFLAHMDQILPRAVSLWMLPETEFMFYQFSLMMPVMFLMLVRLARIGTGLSKMADLGISVGLLVGIPMGIYIIGMALSRVMHSFSHYDRFGMQYVLTAGLIAATALVLVAFLKILLRLHEAVSGQAWSQWVIPIFAGLVAPLAGLTLNAGIPFPYDFQDIAVYALTILNGAALLIPFRPGSRWAVTGWALRAALFPFSLYFFLVFLPFFPLSLLAMIAAGSGVLILAPILLLAIHGKLLLDQGRILSASYGGRLIAAGFAACLLVLPALFVIRCDSDRRTLGKALDAVYSPDYQSKTIAFSPTRLSRALKHMDDVKNGIYLPYLTDAYNTIVFRGMVLPDEKADLIRRSLLGTTPERESRLPFWGRGIFGGRPRGLRASRGAGVSHDVQMATPEINSRTTNDVVEADVKLTLENRGSDNSEFVALIIVPEGVLVTGFWLDINGTNKPAQLREKKTAVWVYEMIRDMTRRDPGLLVYETDASLKLRVYPFGPAQSRKCGITFRFPAMLNPVVQIKGLPVALNAAPQSGGTSFSVVLPKAGEALIVSAASDNGLPQFVRQPVARIILDRSAAASGKDAETIVAAKAAIAALPASVQQVKVTWANYDQAAVLSNAGTRDEAIAALDRRISLPFRGGFCPELAIARELFEEQGNITQAQPQPAGPVQLFVVIPAPGSSSVRTRALQPLVRAVPDMPAYFEYSSNGWAKISFDSGNKDVASPLDAPISPVMAIRNGGHVELLSPTDGGLVFTTTDSGKGSWECWDPAQNAFKPINGVMPCTDQLYIKGLALMARHRALAWAPGAIDAALPGIVTDARAAGVMVPETAFVVVESSAQEVMLARKEQQALSADHALEFDDVKPSQTTPAPPALWLLPLAVFLLYRHGRKTARGAAVGHDNRCN